MAAAGRSPSRAGCFGSGLRGGGRSLVVTQHPAPPPQLHFPILLLPPGAFQGCRPSVRPASPPKEGQRRRRTSWAASKREPCWGQAEVEDFPLHRRPPPRAPGGVPFALLLLPCSGWRMGGGATVTLLVAAIQSRASFYHHPRTRQPACLEGAVLPPPGTEEEASFEMCGGEKGREGTASNKCLAEFQLALLLNANCQAVRQPHVVPLNKGN